MPETVPVSVFTLKAVMTTEDRDIDSVCCPELAIVLCADTEEHCHLVCSYSKAVLTNDTVRQQCIGDFSGCVLQSKT